jgi:hypothetical protein
VSSLLMEATNRAEEVSSSWSAENTGRHEAERMLL